MIVESEKLVMNSMRITRSTLCTIAVGVLLLLVTVLHTVGGTPEDVFKLVSTGQSFVETTDVSAFQSLAKIACASICLARSCLGFCFNPGTKECLVLNGPATWAPLTPATGTRLYWIEPPALPQPGFTYVFYGEERDYAGAKTACNSLSMILAAPMKDVQWEVFKNTVGPHTFAKPVRVWADDLVNDGDMLWGPNSLHVNPTSNWLSGFPHTGLEGLLRGCMFVYQNGFVDGNCRIINCWLPYACEKPVPDCVPTFTPYCFIL